MIVQSQKQHLCISRRSNKDKGRARGRWGVARLLNSLIQQSYCTPELIAAVVDWTRRPLGLGASHKALPFSEDLFSTEGC